MAIPELNIDGSDRRPEFFDDIQWQAFKTAAIFPDEAMGAREWGLKTFPELEPDKAEELIKKNLRKFNGLFALAESNLRTEVSRSKGERIRYWRVPLPWELAEIERKLLEAQPPEPVIETPQYIPRPDFLKNFNEGPRMYVGDKFRGLPPDDLAGCKFEERYPFMHRVYGAPRKPKD